ncbi:outer membrane beta-barrel protein [Prevotella nigrescens]
MVLKHTLFATILLALLSIPASIHAEDLKGRVLDANTKEPIEKASVKIEIKSGNSTQIMDITSDAEGKFSCSSSFEGRMTIKASMIGYETATRHSYSSGYSGTDTLDLGDFLLKPTELMLDDVVVTAKARRFTMSGDTIVFHPEAFKLKEGARLDELIKRLPGVVEKDGKLYWNNKPLRMLMNGRDIFGGGSIVGEIPAEAVKNIKTYNKASELAQQSGNDDGKDDNVLDINIKPGFMDKWYGDMTARLQTPKNYQASVQSNLLSDRNPTLVSIDANNVDYFQKLGIDWYNKGNFDNFGKAQSAAAAWQHNWKQGTHKFSNRNNVSFSSNFNHTDGWGTEYRTDQTIPTLGNAKTWGLSRNKRYEHKIQPTIMADLFTFADSVNYITADLKFEYTFQRKNEEASSARFNSNPEAFGDFPLDPALMTKHGDDIYRHLINRKRTYAQSMNEALNTTLNAKWGHLLGKKGQFSFGATANYSNGNNRTNTNQQIDYVEQGVQSPLYQYSRLPFHNLDFKAYTELQYYIKNNLLLTGGYTFDKLNKSVRQDFYSTDVQSKLDNNRDEVKDAANSFDSHRSTATHTAQAGLTYKLDKWQFLPNIKVDWLHEHLDYQRGRLDTASTRNSVLINPNMEIKWKIGKRSNFDFTFNYTTSLPDLLSTLAYRDDTDPLWIKEGNPLLHRSHKHSSMVTYRQTLPRVQSMMLLKAGYTHNINPIASVFYYNPATGVYRTHDENVRGGDEWLFSAVLDKGIGDNFHLFTKAETYFTTSYGYLAALNETVEKQQNKLKQLTLNLSPELSYEHDWLVLNLFGSMNLRRNRYSLASEYNNTFGNYNFGLKGLAKLKQWEFSTKFEDRLRSGYLSPEINRHRLVWNANAKWLFWKGKGVLGIDLDDILNQAVWNSSTITPTQRTEQWEEAMHHFARISFTYKFDAKSKNQRR